MRIFKVLTFLLLVTVAYAEDLAALGSEPFVNAEVGENDLRFSTTGADGDGDFRISLPDLAYNPVDNEYLLVWSSNAAGIFDEAIYGQRVDGSTGARIGDDFVISSQTWDADDPTVVYNPAAHQYLVVYATGLLADDTVGIYGQFLDAASGQPTGPTEFRISHTEGSLFLFSWAPDVAYSPIQDEYLVVWDADGIFFQRLDANGLEIGGDVEFSQDGSDGRAVLAYNEVDDEYLFVFTRSNNFDGSQIDIEIFGQRIQPSTGTPLGPRVQLSQMGGDGLTNNRRGSDPEVVYNSVENEYMVTWVGDVSNSLDQEIFVQRVRGLDGAQVGRNDLQVSDVAPGSSFQAASGPTIAFDPDQNQYIVAWSADHIANEEFEIYLQRLDSQGRQVGVDDHRVSDMGPEGIDEYNTRHAGLAYNSVDRETMVIWAGNELVEPGTFLWDTEVYGQRFGNMVGRVALGAAPLAPPVTIPPEGGTFQAVATVTNTTAEPQTVDVWFRVVKLEDGIDNTAAPLRVTVAAFDSVDVERVVSIPGAGPGGEYGVIFITGVFPIQAERSGFRVEKLE